MWISYYCAININRLCNKQRIKMKKNKWPSELWQRLMGSTVPGVLFEGRVRAGQGPTNRIVTRTGGRGHGVFPATIITHFLWKLNRAVMLAALGLSRAAWKVRRVFVSKLSDVCGRVVVMESRGKGLLLGCLILSHSSLGSPRTCSGQGSSD